MSESPANPPADAEDRAPATYTAPAAGYYHLVSGSTPHLSTDCDEACPLHSGRGAKQLAARPDGAPAVRAIEMDLPAFIAAVTDTWRAVRDALSPILQAAVNAFRPLIEYLEAHPEVLAELRTASAPDTCKHLCARGPEHECAGDATTTYTFPRGRRVPVPMCEPCARVAETAANESLAMAAAAIANAAGPERLNWLDEGTVCGHVCGSDPDHVCEARSSRVLTYPLPSGGRRAMRVCDPCYVSETAAIAQAG